MNSLRRLGFLLGVATAVLSFAVDNTDRTHAASFLVNSTSDSVDVLPGDGVCADSIGACTLRAAVMETNALPGPDVIDLPAGTYTLTIPGANEDGGATGDLDITDNLTLTGAGATNTIIDGGGFDRVIHSAHNGQTIQVVFSGITIQNGDASSGGGGVFNGRFGRGLFALRDSVIRDNTNFSNGGGGIHNIGIVELENVSIARNHGGVDGGGIFNQGTLTVSRSVISDNLANSTGGGIDSGGSATITDSTISGNFADFGAGGGGGIHNFGTMSIATSTLSGNVSEDWAGGIGNGGELEMINVTVSGNLAGTDGGGLWNHPIGSSYLNNVTLSNNEAYDGGGVFAVAAQSYPDQIRIRNTIVAGNISVDCASPVSSLGYNLDSDGSCGLAGPGDLPNRDPLLGPLADNGGPTHTHALLFDSPAIDAGDNAGCPSTDQRGVQRPIDGDRDNFAICDIGAYEFEPGPPITPGAVGGIAGLHPEATVANGTESSSSPRGIAVSGVAGSVVAAVLAAAWYARKRWLA
jgi:hypothetical protein